MSECPCRGVCHECDDSPCDDCTARCAEADERRERIRESAERTAEVSAGLNERLAADERRETHNHPAGHGCTPRCVVPSDHDTDQCECDDRRERYAAAIIEPDGVIWEMLTDDEKFAEYARADAAIAVADAEAAHLGTELVEMGQELSARKREGDHLVELNNRLRAELKGAHAGAEHLRRELEQRSRDFHIAKNQREVYEKAWREEKQKNGHLEKNNAELRRDFQQVSDNCDQWFAAVERVEAVLNEPDVDEESWLYGAIKSAVKIPEED